MSREKLGGATLPIAVAAISSALAAPPPTPPALAPPPAGLGYEIRLVAEPGRQRIGLAVRDDVARVSSSLIQEVDVDRLGTATAVTSGSTPPRAQ